MSDHEPITHFWAKNKRFARKSDERIPSPDRMTLTQTTYARQQQNPNILNPTTTVYKLVNTLPYPIMRRLTRVTVFVYLDLSGLVKWLHVLINELHGPHMLGNGPHV